MQRYCTELTERLLKSLDKEYNVVDMGAVVDVITALEKTTITKEVLEVTRLGKYINELRRKTNNDALAKRAKDLVRRWRDMVLPSSHPMPQPTPADTAPQALNGTKPQSPALRGLKPHSPATIRSLKPHSPALKASLKPQSPLFRDSTPLKVLSPAGLSLHSEKSRSPNAASTKHLQQGSLSHVAPTTTTASTTNNRLNTDVTSKLSSISTHNHTFDAVPRTHSSNKRLRKEDSSGTNSPITPPLASALSSSSSSVPPSTASVNRPLVTSSTNESHVSSRFEPPIKRARLNGETSNYSNFPYHTTDTSNNNVVSSRSTTNSGSNANVSSTPNQKVPSPRETEKTNDRLSDVVISSKIEAPRDTTNPVEGSTTPAQTPPGPKKRGRKKGSKSVKNQSLPEDRVKEKLASISRNPKLKTTQELLADLQARGSTTSTNFPTGNTTSGPNETAIATTTTATTTIAISNISNRKNETSNADDLLHSAANDERSLSLSRFNRAKRDKTNLSVGEKRKNRDNKNSGNKRAWDDSKKSEDDEDDEDEDESEREEIYVDNPRTRELTVEEILAKLPPLDRDAITWSDCEDIDADTRIDDVEYGDLTKNKRDISEKDVERLHNECIEGLNGNFQSKIHDTKIEDDTLIIVKNNDAEIIDEIKSKSIYRRLEGKENDREFCEWHEMLARPSYEGQTLHILPYVIID